MEEDLKHHPTHGNETPPPHSQSITFLSYPKQKTHTHTHTHNNHQHAPPHAPAAAYKECLKNHAASIGGHAVDGCGEFMAEPSSFKCSACGCHRNFHRREPTTTTTTITTATRPPHFLDFNRPQIPTPSTSPSPLSPPSPPPQPTNIAYGGHLLLSLSTAADPPGTPVAVKVHGRKRFRTKFSQEQKEKMQNFAEKVGWKMQRCDDKMVTDLCNDIGIKRRIFKVWMHNNKNTLAKKDTTTSGAGAAVNSAVNSALGGGLARSEDHLQDSTNGSSSSS